MSQSTFVLKKPSVLTGIKSEKVQCEQVLRLDQAAAAYQFAEKISKGRLLQIEDLLRRHANGRIHSVEALMAIQEIANRSD